MGEGTEMVVRRRRVGELVRWREEELMGLERERVGLEERAWDELLWLVILAKGE